MSHLFDPPIFVSSGKHLIQEVCGIEDAIDVLSDWPDERRDLVYETVLAACRGVLDGRRTNDVAQRAFRKWAERVGILADLAVAANIAALKQEKGTMAI